MLGPDEEQQQSARRGAGHCSHHQGTGAGAMPRCMKSFHSPMGHTGSAQSWGGGNGDAGMFLRADGWMVGEHVQEVAIKCQLHCEKSSVLWKAEG